MHLLFAYLRVISINVCYLLIYRLVLFAPKVAGSYSTETINDTQSPNDPGIRKMAQLRIGKLSMESKVRYPFAWKIHIRENL